MLTVNDEVSLLFTRMKESDLTRYTDCRLSRDLDHSIVMGRPEEHSHRTQPRYYSQEKRVSEREGMARGAQSSLVF